MDRIVSLRPLQGRALGMIKVDDTGLNHVSDFKSFYTPVNTVLSCLSLHFGSPKAMRSYHICCQVILTGTFSSGQDGLLTYRPSALCLVFPASHIHFWDLLVSPSSSNGFPNIIILSHNWVQHGFQCPIPGDGSRLENLGFNTCSECGLIRAFKDRSIDGLSHLQLFENLLHFLYKLPGSYMPRKFPLIRPSLPAGQNDPIYKGMSTSKLPPPLLTPRHHADAAREQGVQRCYSFSLSCQ